MIYSISTNQMVIPVENLHAKQIPCLENVPKRLERVMKFVIEIAKKMINHMREFYLSLQEKLNNCRYKDPDEQYRRKIFELIPEVKNINNKISCLFAFIENHPDLEEKWREHLIKYAEAIIIHRRPEFGDFDPNNLVDHITKLQLEKNYLQSRLNQYMRYICCSRIVSNLFRLHAIEEKNARGSSEALTILQDYEMHNR